MSYEFYYKVDNEKYKVVVIKKNNKNTYIKIKDDLTIYVTTNMLVTKWQIKSMLDDEQEYLKKALTVAKAKYQRQQDFYYLGKKYDIVIVPFDAVEIDDDKIYAPSYASLDKWLQKQMLEVFNERLEIKYSLFEEDIPFPKLKTRKMKTRWGVCNKRDTSVTLNSRLIRYEIHEIDYVIVHELSHLVHFDHSKAFWQTVAKYMPDYKKAVRILKEQ